jgi:hypothetical protein
MHDQDIGTPFGKPPSSLARIRGPVVTIQPRALATSICSVSVLSFREVLTPYFLSPKSLSIGN